MKHSLLVLFLSLNFNVFSNNISLTNCILYNYICTQNIEKWTTVKKNTSSYTDLVHDYFIEYFWIAHLISQNKNDEAKFETAKLEQRINESLSFTNSTETEILQASLLMFKAYLYKQYSLYYLPKALYKLSSLNKQFSNNPYLYIEQANFDYHLPFFLGGNYENAIINYSKGIELFETMGYETKCNWYYLNAHIWLAKSYENTNQNEKAIGVYEKILVSAPNFTAVNRWIKKLR